MTEDMAPQRGGPPGRFHHLSSYDDGPRRPLSPGEQARWWFWLMHALDNGLISPKTWQVGRALRNMLGDDGRLDPSYEAIAGKARCARSTVAGALIALADVGLLGWIRRLGTVEIAGHQFPVQRSNAYWLIIPSLLPPPEQILSARARRRAARREKRAFWEFRPIGGPRQISPEAADPEARWQAQAALAAIAQRRQASFVAGWTPRTGQGPPIRTR